MDIKDCGELKEYDGASSEIVLYLTAVRYSTNCWMAGPSGTDKNNVMDQLRGYVGVQATRIYSVTVPVSGIPVE